MEHARYVERVAYIHVGTHKTGTTSIQSLLALNERRLRNAGVHVPRAGRPERGSGAHHNIAWQLSGDERFDARRGTLDDLLTEIAGEMAPRVCITSEEFELLFADERALRRLRDGFVVGGYAPRIVLYLRPQVDYLESLYAELLKLWRVDFNEFLDGVITRGQHGPSLLDYARLTDAFAAVFGRENLIVRAYRSALPDRALLREFAETIAPEASAINRLTFPRRLNGKACVSEVLSLRLQQVGTSALNVRSLGERFEPLELLDIMRVIARFARSNERVMQNYGTRIGCVTLPRLSREILRATQRNRENAEWKQTIRELREARLEAVV